MENSEVTELPKDRFLDRELSWLAFNQRVLEMATTAEIPALERARYLAIFTNNLDEFFMVRVAGLKRRIAAGIATRAVTGKLPREIHEGVLLRSRELTRWQSEILNDMVFPELKENGITLVRWQEVSDDAKVHLSEWFKSKVFPVLTPLAVDPSHPFPYISGLSLNLAIMVRNPVTKQDLFARVKVPPTLSRFVLTSPEGEQFIPLEDVIAAHLDMLFPGMEILQHHTFRVTRNEELDVEEDDAENLLAALERELTRRRFGAAVRLEVEDTMDPEILAVLKEELEVDKREVFSLPWPLDLRGLSDIVGLNRDDLKFPAFVPKTNHELASVESSSPPDILEAMRNGDILLHHPYDSFSTSVQLFLEQAARDPQVLAIKQTLYRTSWDSPIVKALIEAAEWGKQVLALVEIKARFDEENNIEWARKLEQAGVHVVYGVVGLKTHCKLSMVVRDEGDYLRRYVHFGTGNYHPKTARIYEDYGLLTTNPTITNDVATLFNVLSGYAIGPEYKALVVAPADVRNGLIERINREITNQQNGKQSRVRFKVNSIVDEAIIDALYRASQAGVSVELLVRGICALRAGVPGLSENIRVVSILGRFLEHSRVYEFFNEGDVEIMIGSPDAMHRNLDRRVETIVNLPTLAHRQYVSERLDLAFSPDVMRWELNAEGEWDRIVRSPEGVPLADFQATLIEWQHRSTQI
jgi:polyphosphate kinase